MSEKMQETIADIVAEKRRRADEIERDCAEKMKRGEIISDCYARELVADIRREADRLEAAHKRERGDCAKLREALEAFMIDFDSNYADDDDIASWCNVNVEIIRKARAALAAPQRNCDRFGTADEAIAEFADEGLYEEWEALRANKDRDMLAMELYHFINWLLATSTEKEGGTNG